MYGNNPYAQAGWPNPQNPLSVTANPWFPSAPQGPTFGALPSSSSGSSEQHAFHFTPVNPNILNCTVVGPGNNIFFRIVTTNDGVTTIFKPRDQAIARIEWAEPAVEISNVVPRQRVTQWLPLSADQRSDVFYRTMVAGGRTYIWVPRGSAIMLYLAGSNPPVEYGSISRSGTSVTLQLTGDAFSTGVLEAAVVATLLFQSGRNIS